MCFETTIFAIRRKARKDIVCWKALTSSDGLFHSPYRNFTYSKGIITPLVEIKKEQRPRWSKTYLQKKINRSVNQGYHSYRTFALACVNWNSWAVHKCIIPKGTYYYKNKSEYVSESIMLVE